MPLKMTRRRFAGLSAAAGASVWVRPFFGETHEAAEWVNPLIGASTSQKLGEGKTFPGPTTPFGLRPRSRHSQVPRRMPQYCLKPFFDPSKSGLNDPYR